MLAALTASELNVVADLFNFSLSAEHSERGKPVERGE